MTPDTSGRGGAPRVASFVLALVAAGMAVLQFVMIGSLAGIAQAEEGGPLIVTATQAHAVVMIVAAVLVVVVAGVGARRTMSGFAVMLSLVVALVMLGHLGVLVYGTVQGVSIVAAAWASVVVLDGAMIVALFWLARVIKAKRPQD